MEKEKTTEAVLQEQLLKKLSDYGDSILEISSKSKKKKKNRKLKSDVDSSRSKAGDKTNSDYDEELDESNTPTEFTGLQISSRRKKKRRKKKCQNEGSGRDEGTDVRSGNTSLTGPKKHMEMLVGELGLKQFKSDLEKQGAGKLASVKKTVSKGEPEVIVFKDMYEKPKRKVKPAPTTQAGEVVSKFDIKEARFEVRKFGLAGFQGDEKEKAMTDLLLRLGAKPKKQSHVNYKEFQQQRKEQLVKEAQKRELDREQGFNVAKKKNRKRPRDNIGSVDGQVGRFQSGVQFVKPNDVQGIKKSKLKNKS